MIPYGFMSIFVAYFTLQIADYTSDSLQAREKAEMCQQDGYYEGQYCLSGKADRKIKRHYRLAKKAYMNGNYKLSMAELKKIHEVVPFYKDSDLILEYANESLKIQYQKRELSNIEPFEIDEELLESLPFPLSNSGE